MELCSLFCDYSYELNEIKTADYGDRFSSNIFNVAGFKFRLDLRDVADYDAGDGKYCCVFLTLMSLSPKISEVKVRPNLLVEEMIEAYLQFNFSSTCKDENLCNIPMQR